MKTENGKSFLLGGFWFVLEVQTQTGRIFFCLVLPRLQTLAKLNQLSGRAQAPWVCTGPEAQGPSASPPLFSWFYESLLLLSVGIFCPWADTFPNSLLLSLCTRVCIPRGRSELDHQFWMPYSNCISRIKKKKQNIDSLRDLTIIMHFWKYEPSENVTRKQKENWDLILCYLSRYHNDFNPSHKRG